MGHPARSTTLLRRWRLKPLAAAIVAAGALGSGDDRAASLVVATLAEQSAAACTLRDAVNSVNAQADQGQCVASGAYGTNDTVAFAPALSGTITFFNNDPLSANPGDPSALVIQRSIAIQGPGSGLLTLVCGSVFYRLLEVDAGVDAASLSGLTIANCTAAGSGGGMLADVRLSNVAMSLQFIDVTLTGLQTAPGGQGGGLAVFGGDAGATVTMTACNISSNRAARGAGLAISTNSVIADTTVSVADSVVAPNTATQLGGGAFVTGPSAEVTFTRTTIDRNRATVFWRRDRDSAGGSRGARLDPVRQPGPGRRRGPRVRFGKPLRSDQLDAERQRRERPRRRVYVLNGGTGALALANTTVSNNKAGAGGGIMIENTLPVAQMTPNVVTIVNTIVAGDATPTDTRSNEPLLPGQVLPWDVAYNVIGVPGNVTLVGTGNVTGGAVPPPLGAGGWLGPLQNNGGPTQTHALLTSVPDPAVDAGDPAFSGLAFDQRGKPFTRVRNGRVDIGAYESGALRSGSGATGPTAVPGPRGPLLAVLSGWLAWLGWRRLRRR